jgi:hypothetical protein
MTKHYANLEVRRMRGNLVLVGTARTDRGQKFIKGQVPIDAEKIGSKEFKEKLALAVKEIMTEAV